MAERLRACPLCAEPIQPAAIICKHCGRDVPQVAGQPKPRISLNKFLLILFVPFMGFAVFGNHDKSASSGSTTGSGAAAASAVTSSQASATAASSSDPLSNIALANVHWRRDGFETIMMASFTIRNLNSFAVKDIEVTCKHYANSGSEIDSNTRTIYERVDASGSFQVREFNMGFIHDQARRTQCVVTDFERV